jgi:hypothetical protein
MEQTECSETSEYLLAYEDGTECSETSAYKIQKTGNYPKENIQQTMEMLALKAD